MTELTEQDAVAAYFAIEAASTKHAAPGGSGTGKGTGAGHVHSLGVESFSTSHQPPYIALYFCRKNEP